MFSKFEKLEKENKWNEAINEIEKIIKNNPNNEDGYIRIIYFLHNYLLEEFNHLSLQDIFKEKLLKYFNEGKKKFSNSSNFLFFIGIILHIAEWYFGVDDDFKKLEDKLCFKMQKKAVELKPENKLFKWSVEFSKGSNKIIKISNEILNNSKYINFLNSYGFPGKYIKVALKYNVKNTIK